MGLDLGDIVDPFDLVDTGGSLAPSNLLGLNAAEDAAGRQAAAANEAIEVLRGDLAPFRMTPEEIQDLLLEERTSVLGGIDTDPGRVLNNPFFDALSEDLTRSMARRAAASGEFGGGDFRNAFARQQLLLGNQFQQQDIERQLQENQQRFQQLFNIATRSQNAAAQTGTQTADLITQRGNAEAAGIVGRGNAISGLFQQGLGGLGGAALGSMGLLGKGVGAGGGAILGLLSDARTKTNVRPVGTSHGYVVYEWDWTEEGKAMAGDQPGFGVLAHEVVEKNPDAVEIDSEGFLRVDYERLINGD